MKRTIQTIGLCCLVAAGLAACGNLPQPEAQVGPNFVFSTASLGTNPKNDMTIAFLQPTGAGAYFLQGSHTPLAKQFINSALADMEKVVVAKGFRSSGNFGSYDEMTFSAKERASLALRSTLSYEVLVQPGLVLAGIPDTAMAAGTVTLELIEPMSKEKVWIKRIELPPSKRQIKMESSIGPDGRLVRRPDGTVERTISKNSMTALLNEFYQTSFSKISEQMDAREILALKSDADKLKQKSGYRAN